MIDFCIKLMVKEKRVVFIIFLKLVKNIEQEIMIKKQKGKNSLIFIVER